MDFSPVHTALPTPPSFPSLCHDDSTDATEKAFVERLNGCLMTLARKVEAKPEVSWPGSVAYTMHLVLSSSHLSAHNSLDLASILSTSSTDITNDLNH